RGRVAIRGVLAWKGTHAGLFLLLVGGGVGLPLPEDLTLLAAGVLAHQHVLRLRDVIAIGFAGVVCADWIIYLAGRRYGRGIVVLGLLALALYLGLRAWIGRTGLGGEGPVTGDPPRGGRDARE